MLCFYTCLHESQARDDQHVANVPVGWFVTATAAFVVIVLVVDCSLALSFVNIQSFASGGLFFPPFPQLIICRD